MAELKPEIDETLYLAKVTVLEVETLVRQLKSGMDTIDAIEEKNSEVYEIINNLHTLLKA